MLAEWRLGVVLESTDGEAKLGWLDRRQRQRAAAVLPLSLSELGWARPVRDGKLGGAPRRMTDVMRARRHRHGRAAMPATPGQNRAPGRPERLTLRQIPQVQGALVTIDPATGRVLAMSGGWSFEMSQFNRATQAQRQPGSASSPMSI